MAQGLARSRARALRAPLQNYYLMVLDHVPALQNETGRAWVTRVHPWEKWWIEYLGTGLLQRGGWDIQLHFEE